MNAILRKPLTLAAAGSLFAARSFSNLFSLNNPSLKIVKYEDLVKWC